MTQKQQAPLFYAHVVRTPVQILKGVPASAWHWLVDTLTIQQAEETARETGTGAFPLRVEKR
jgi:hypothetical protein